jgi:hypothetical protein
MILIIVLKNLIHLDNWCKAIAKINWYSNNESHCTTGTISSTYNVNTKNRNINMSYNDFMNPSSTRIHCKNNSSNSSRGIDKQYRSELSSKVTKHWQCCEFNDNTNNAENSFISNRKNNNAEDDSNDSDDFLISESTDDNDDNGHEYYDDDNDRLDYNLTKYSQEGQYPSKGHQHDDCHENKHITGQDENDNNTTTTSSSSDETTYLESIQFTDTITQSCLYLLIRLNAGNLI